MDARRSWWQGARARSRRQVATADASHAARISSRRVRGAARRSPTRKAGRMKGLAFGKTADAIAAFVKQHGASAPRRAVLCTYDLDPVRFEVVVLPELTRRRRWFRTLVLADAASLQKRSLRRRIAKQWFGSSVSATKARPLFRAHLARRRWKPS